LQQLKLRVQYVQTSAIHYFDVIDAQLFPNWKNLFKKDSKTSLRSAYNEGFANYLLNTYPNEKVNRYPKLKDLILL